MTNLNREFYHYLQTGVELSPEEIEIATPNEILDHVLAYEGYGVHAGYAIRRWIQLIYDVDLNDLSLHELMHRGKEIIENE